MTDSWCVVGTVHWVTTDNLRILGGRKSLTFIHCSAECNQLMMLRVGYLGVITSSSPRSRLVKFWSATVINEYDAFPKIKSKEAPNSLIQAPVLHHNDILKTPRKKITVPTSYPGTSLGTPPLPTSAPILPSQHSYNWNTGYKRPRRLERNTWL